MVAGRFYPAGHRGSCRTAGAPASLFIKRSADGIHFTTAGAPVVHSGPDYQFEDSVLPAGNWYYRIWIREISGVIKYSAVIRISSSGEAMRVLDRTGKIAVQYSAITAGQLQLTIYTADGQLLLQQELQVNPGTTEWVTLVHSKGILLIRTKSGSGILLQEKVRGR